MALIRLDVNAEMGEVNRFLEKADAATVNLANHAVAKASKNTRSGARQVEGSLLMSAKATATPSTTREKVDGEKELRSPIGIRRERFSRLTTG